MGPIELIGAFNSLRILKDWTKTKVQKRPDILVDKADFIIKKLEEVTNFRNEQLKVTLHSGFQLLADGVSTNNVQTKRDQFTLARGKFAGLVAQDRKHVFFRVAGYLGNYHYFTLNEEYHLAQQQALLSAIDHPVFSVLMFGEDAFDKKYVQGAVVVSMARSPFKFDTEDELEAYIRNRINLQQAEDKAAFRSQFAHAMAGVAAGIGVFVSIGVLAPPGVVAAGPAALMAFRGIADNARKPSVIITDEQIAKLRQGFKTYIEMEKKYAEMISTQARAAYDKVHRMTPTSFARLIGQRYY
jgi:hypothetical protein